MNIKKIIIVVLLLTTNYISHPTPSYAINMNSNEYKIQFGVVDSGGGKMTDPVNNSYNLSSSLGQAVAKEFQSNGYVVKAGFQYVTTPVPFTFYLSNIRVDLGTLLPNSPSTGAITLKVSFGGAGQYIVTARADRPLTEIQGLDSISFTACNGGANTCSLSTAKLWTNANAYGFGYGMTGQDVPSDFISSSYYRPFPNRLLSENAVTIMQSSTITADVVPTPIIPFTPAPALTGVPSDSTHEAIITMKANISGIQPAGTYATVIRFLATPSF